MSPLRCLLPLLALCCAPLAAFAEQDAHATVQEATDRLLVKIAEVKPLYEAEPDRFYAEVDGVLGPYIDFEYFARGVMGKYSRTATPEQREQFTAMFKQDLIRTYARALVEFDNERIDVLPTDGKEQKSPDAQTVHMEIHGKNGNVYPVDYTMALTDGEWKLRNVIVNGINLGLTFRKHFQQLYSENGRDVAKVIESWNSRVSQEG